MSHARNLVPVGILLVVGLLVPTTPVLAQSDSPDVSRRRVEVLTEEVRRLNDQLSELRHQLAEARLEASEAGRKLAELEQFVQDHEQLGADFEQYTAVKEVAEEESRLRTAEESRLRRDAYRADRLARYRAARSKRNEEKAEKQRLARYSSAGFAPVGFDVYAGRMAFSYKTKDTNPVRVDYDPWLGLYYRPGGTAEIDYGRMTISGSVLNAADEVRNIGIAITFFDGQGNQVGAETIQIDNARPNVPYPFTSTLEMAPNRPFDSSSVYVLYADRPE